MSRPRVKVTVSFHYSPDLGSAGYPSGYGPRDAMELDERALGDDEITLEEFMQLRDDEFKVQFELVDPG